MLGVSPLNEGKPAMQCVEVNLDDECVEISFSGMLDASTHSVDAQDNDRTRLARGERFKLWLESVFNRRP